MGIFSAWLAETTDRTYYEHGSWLDTISDHLALSSQSCHSWTVPSRWFKTVSLPKNHGITTILLHLMSCQLTDPNRHRIKPFCEYPLVIQTNKRMSLAHNYFKGIKVCPLWDWPPSSFLQHSLPFLGLDVRKNLPGPSWQDDVIASCGPGHKNSQDKLQCSPEQMACCHLFETVMCAFANASFSLMY